jgi:vacuolar-type H+-ATPase subunit I/STV1
MKVYIWKNENNETMMMINTAEGPPFAQVFEVEDVSDIIWDEALKKFRLKTDEEKINNKKEFLQNLRKQKVSSLLVQTDYVITKLSDLKTQLELGLITQSVYEAEIQKYQPIMQKRHKIREWNTNIEARIQNVSSLEELKQIEGEINGYQG